jgi:uncharacterized protein YdaU (DUF1376 family)
MGLYYLPFWLEVWYKDYKVQALPRNTRLILYDLLFILWDKDMYLANDDQAISYYMRISQTEWIDAKLILLKHGFIKTIQAGKRITCDRLAMEYERVMENKHINENRAKKGWETRKKSSP